MQHTFIKDRSWLKLKTMSVTFRFETADVERLQQEAHSRGVSLNSLFNQILRNYFEWHIFEPKVGFVLILKPVVKKVFTNLSKEQIAQIAEKTAKEESENSIYFMKGRIDLDSFLSWFEARMKNSSIQVSHTFDNTNMVHTFVVKHDICVNWSLYLKYIIEHIFHKDLGRKVEISTSDTTLTFRFSQV
jgi:hypothetical protein